MINPRLLSEPHSIPGPDVLTPGRWLRIATEGPIYDRHTQELIVDLDLAMLSALADYVESQREDAPIMIDYGHDHRPLGQIMGARVVEDDRGVGLEVAPSYTKIGIDCVLAHGGVLWTSPEIAPGGFDKRTGAPVSGAILRAVSLTPLPRSPASGLDRVMLSEPIEPAEALAEGQTMPERIAELEAALQAKDAEIEAMEAKIDALTGEAEVTAEASEAVAVASAELAERNSAFSVQLAERDQRIEALEQRVDDAEFANAFTGLQAAGHTALSEEHARAAWHARKAGQPIFWDQLAESVPTPGGKPIGVVLGHNKADDTPKSVAKQIAELALSENISRAEAFTRIRGAN